MAQYVAVEQFAQSEAVLQRHRSVVLPQERMCEVDSVGALVRPGVHPHSRLAHPRNDVADRVTGILRVEEGVGQPHIPRFSLCPVRDWVQALALPQAVVFGQFREELLQYVQPPPQDLGALRPRLHASLPRVVVGDEQRDHGSGIVDTGAGGGSVPGEERETAPRRILVGEKLCIATPQPYTHTHMRTENSPPPPLVPTGQLLLFDVHPQVHTTAGMEHPSEGTQTGAVQGVVQDARGVDEMELPEPHAFHVEKGPRYLRKKE